MNDLPDTIERLTARLETLELRVYTLEHPSDAGRALSASEPIPSQTVRAAETLPFVLAGGAFTVLGKALFGIAGAYLLRAIEESTSLPKLGVATLAIGYAMLWLVWATRVPVGAWFASITYACTAAVILAPMLWELTLNFKILPPPLTACILCGFVSIAYALAWKRNLTAALWVANLTSVVVALALSFRTHDLVSFIAALLLIALLSECAAARNHGLNIRFLVAVAADLAIFALIFIYSSPQSSRQEYPSLGTLTLLAPGFLLFLIYGASVCVKTTILRQEIAVFDIVQATIAFLLAAFSLFYFEPRSGTAILGLLCLVLAAASYAATFALFERLSDQRNFKVFAAWSGLLFLAGNLLGLPLPWQAICLGVASIAATILGVLLNRTTLGYHGLVFLLAAAFTSGLMNYALSALTGTLPAGPSWAVCFVFLCAACSYATGKLCQVESWKQKFLHLVTAFLTVGCAAALLVQGLAWLTGYNVHPTVHHLAFIRTFTICVASLALAFSGSHWRRVELTRVGYATLVFVVAKLVFEDLRQPRLEFIAASIFVVAATLLAVPRISRMGQPV